MLFLDFGTRCRDTEILALEKVLCIISVFRCGSNNDSFTLHQEVHLQIQMCSLFSIIVFGVRVIILLSFVSLCNVDVL